MVQTIEITISGGTVQYVEFPRGIRVLVRGYDVDGVDEKGEFDIRRDEQGDLYEYIEFVHEEDEGSSPG